MSPRTLKALSWGATLLIAGLMLMSAALYLSGAPEVQEGLTHLGYPAYFLIILGTAKLLGSLAILQSRVPLLREWAYAGFTFVLLGATASHLFSGDAIGVAAFPAALLLPLAVSYQLRHARGAVTQAASGLTASLA